MNKHIHIIGNYNAPGGDLMYADENYSRAEKIDIVIFNYCPTCGERLDEKNPGY